MHRFQGYTTLPPAAGRTASGYLIPLVLANFLWSSPALAIGDFSLPSTNFHFHSSGHSGGGGFNFDFFGLFDNHHRHSRSAPPRPANTGPSAGELLWQQARAQN